MTILQFAILGLIQGLTEFLPVSSSGHLVLFGSIFGTSETLFVSILLHVATLCSILVVMRKEVLYLLKNPFSKEARKLYISTIATFIVVLLIYNFAKNAYVEKYLPFFFISTAVILLISELFSKKRKNRELSLKQALIIGVAQGFAIFPGLSRSGTTISVGMFVGGDRESVSKFSFLLSIPIILASMFMETIELVNSKVMVSQNMFGLIIGFLVSFTVGIISLKIMIKATSKIGFRYFAIYLIILSIILLII